MSISRKKFITTGIAVTISTAFSTKLLAKIINEPKSIINMTKNVGILVFDDVEVLDFAGPFEVFSVTSQLNDFKPFQVFTLSQSIMPIRAVNGLKVVPDYSIDDHPVIDILILSGGQGTRKLLTDNRFLQWIQKVHATTQLTICICSGARVLAKLGLLNDKPFCTHHEVYEHIQEIAPLGIPQRDKRFVQSDERLYTSGGISAGIDLSFHIVEKLLGEKVASDTAFYMEYDLRK